MTIKQINIFNLIDNFNNKYLKESAKLPFHINILDELHANENAHSRILVKILSYHENDKFPFLENLFQLLDGDFKNLNICKPILTAEKHRIDLLIEDKQGEYAIIVENKIHGAIDQQNQINNYISKLQISGFNRNQIYVIYLTKSGGTPSENSINEKEIEILSGRYKEINFRDYILPWLEDYILPNCRIKDTYFISAVQQYIDHLKGMFHKRTIDKDMNNELNNWIFEQLDLNKLEKQEKIKIINEKKEKVDRIQNYLAEMQKETIHSLFFEWKNKITQKLPNDKIESNIICDNPDKDYFYLGIKFKYQQLDFLCAIGMDDYLGKPYYGVTRRNCTESKDTTFQNWVNKEFAGLGFKESPRWYALKETEFSNIDAEYLNLIDKLLTIPKIIKPSP